MIKQLPKKRLIVNITLYLLIMNIPRLQVVMIKPQPRNNADNTNFKGSSKKQQHLNV